MKHFNSVSSHTSLLKQKDNRIQAIGKINLYTSWTEYLKIGDFVPQTWVSVTSFQK